MSTLPSNSPTSQDSPESAPLPQASTAGSSPDSENMTPSNKQTPPTTAFWAKMEEINRKLEEQGKLLKLPHEGGVVITGAHYAKERAKQLQQQRQQNQE